MGSHHDTGKHQKQRCNRYRQPPEPLATTGLFDERFSIDAGSFWNACCVLSGFEDNHDASLRHLLDDLQEFVAAITEPTGQLDQFPRLLDDDTSLGSGSCDRHAMPARKLQQALVPERVQAAEDRVRVHPEHRGQVPSRRKPRAGFCLTVGYGSADGSSDLFVEGDRTVKVDFDIWSGTSHTVIIRLADPASSQGGEIVADATYQVAGAGAIASAMRKLGAIAAVVMTLMLVASPSIASSTVATPRTVSASSPCQSGPITNPATHVPSSGLVEVDLDTHKRFVPIRVLPLDNPQAATLADGYLYASYAPPGPKAGFRVARIDPRTGALLRSVWFPGYYYNLPPVTAFGSIWVFAGLRKQQIVRMNQATLAVTMRIPVPKNVETDLVASDGALWLPSEKSASLVRLDPRTGHMSTVVLPEMDSDSQVFGVTSDPRSGLIYISVGSQDAIDSELTERFDPETGSFFVVPSPPGAFFSVRGIAGGVLWVAAGPGMMTHFVAFSARTLTPLSCTKSETCALSGANGTVDGTFGDGIFAFEQAGGGLRPGYWLLECVGGSRPSTVARLQLPSDSAPSLGAGNSPISMLTIGDGYLVTFARVATNVGSGVAIFPLDPRCAS